MVDLGSQYQNIKEEADAAMQEVIDSCAFINGPAVHAFASELADYTGVKNVIPCGNGTDALQIALMAVGLQAGDEVIVPVFTYVATAEVIALLNLKPVFVDVDPNTFNIDVAQSRKVITSKTKAIVPVHLFGQCADMEPLLALAKEFDLKVIEDTAQAIGAAYTFSDGTVKQAGTMGDIGTTSFFPSKNLGCFGDGGAMLINDDDLAKQAKMIANHGQRIKYHHDIIGCNSRLDTLQAALLRVKLKHLNTYNANRLSVADRYDEAFAAVPELSTPVRSERSTHVFHQYTLKVNGVERDALKNRLMEKGVPSMVYYPVPLHHQKAYQQEECAVFLITEGLCQVVLSLPVHTEMDSEQQEFIIDAVKTAIDELR